METVRIRYEGGSLGRTIWRGPVTGAAYMFSGAKREQVVDARDAAALVKLEERGKRLFRWASTLPLRIGWVVPTVGCFGSVREMVEVSNALAGRGHQVTIYSPDGGPVVWLPCRASYGNLEAARRAELDVLLGIVDWQPELYRVLVESRAKRRGVCLMGVHPSAELICRLARGVTDRGPGVAGASGGGTGPGHADPGRRCVPIGVVARGDRSGGGGAVWRGADGDVSPGGRGTPGGAAADRLRGGPSATQRHGHGGGGARDSAGALSGGGRALLLGAAG